MIIDIQIINFQYNICFWKTFYEKVCSFKIIAGHKYFNFNIRKVRIIENAISDFIYHTAIEILGIFELYFATLKLLLNSFPGMPAIRLTQ